MSKKKARYKTFEQQNLFSIDESCPQQKYLFLKNLIEDRKSKFSATFYKVMSSDQVKQIIKNLRKDKFYKKATHNIYAFRIKMSD